MDMASPRMNREKHLSGMKRAAVNIRGTAATQVLSTGIKEGGSFKETIPSTLSFSLQSYTSDQYYATKASQSNNASRTQASYISTFTGL